MICRWTSFGRLAFALAMVVSLRAVSPVTAQPSPPALQTCLAAAADFSPVYPTSSFAGGLREVVCVFNLADHEQFQTLTSVWTAVDVGDVAPPNYEIARGDLKLNNQKRGKLRYSQDGPLPVGSYRLDVLADGKPWQAVEFQVETPPEQVPIAQPNDLFPLQQGWTWRYNFVQQAGKGATLPGADASGRITSNVTMTVVGQDDAGAHIEIRRGNEAEPPVAEEWWRCTDKGLVSPRRKYQGELWTFDPPQLLLALPLENGKRWTYTPSDSSFTQSCLMWGPLEVRSAPEGRLGWVVLTQQSIPPQDVTVERHFVPGFGMTHEVIIQAVNGSLLSRQQMTLSGATAPSGAAAAAPPSSDAADAVDYFPVAQGMVWTYEATGGAAQEISKAVTGMETVGGRDCFVIRDEGMSGFLATMHVWRGADAVHLLKARFELQPLVWLKLPLRAGDAWTSELITTSGQRGGTMKFTVVGQEDVQTPSGAYKAMRVDVVGETEGPTLNMSMWLAPGVGEVKRTTRLDSGSSKGETTVMTLKAFKQQ